ncbi:MAG: hypothetical protein AB8F65_07510 [Woeseiaceae bacterium]
MTETITMYRPCGQGEYDLVAKSGFTQWPPRLAEQPIFYPVTNLEYAEEVNNWNVRQFGKGYVTKFDVKASFVEQYPIETVGGKNHTEWWIPAEDLERLNANIVGLIEVVSERHT